MGDWDVVSTAPAPSSWAVTKTAPATGRSFGQVVGEGLSAVGGDIKDAASGIAGLFKIPGDVVKGKYGQAGDPRMEAPARDFATLMVGGELPGVKSAAEAGANVAGSAASKTAGAATSAGSFVGKNMPGAASKAIGGVSDIAPVTNKSVLGSKLVGDLAPKYQDLAARGKAATQQLSSIGEPTDRSVLGQRMMKDLRPDYEAQFEARKAELERASPSSGYLNANPAEQARMNDARRKVYDAPAYEDLRTFENSPLGRQIAADTTKYSDTPRMDPYDLPARAFKSADTVKNLRQLLKGFGNPQDAVESYAGEHAAQSLKTIVGEKDVSGAAKAVEAWATRNRAWLNEVPKTKAAVQSYVDGLKSQAGALDKFSKSTLGQVIKSGADPFSLPSKVFHSSDSVQELRDLLSGVYSNPQDAIEKHAGEYASQSLHETTTGKDIHQAAQSVRQWVVKNRAWLDETPITKAAVQHYADTLESVSKAQKIGRPLARWAAAGAVGGAGVEVGRHVIGQ